jgi:hypothetical protein
LEKELGFDVSDASATTPTSQNSVIESASPKDANKPEGLIPTNWISSFLGGSMPVEESSKILSWAIFNGERFAGKATTLQNI